MRGRVIPLLQLRPCSNLCNVEIWYDWMLRLDSQRTRYLEKDRTMVKCIRSAACGAAIILLIYLALSTIGSIGGMCSGPLVRAPCSGCRAGLQRRRIVTRSGQLSNEVSLKRR